MRHPQIAARKHQKAFKTRSKHVEKPVEQPKQLNLAQIPSEISESYPEQ